MSRFIRTARNMRAFNGLSFLNGYNQVPFLLLASALKNKSNEIIHFDSAIDNIKLEIVNEVKQSTDILSSTKSRRILYSPDIMKIVYSVPDPSDDYNISIGGNHFNYLDSEGSVDDGNEILVKDNIILSNKFDNSSQKFFYSYISFLVSKEDFINNYGFVPVQNGDRLYSGFQADINSLVSLYLDDGTTVTPYTQTDFLDAVSNDFTKGLILEDVTNLNILPLQVESNDTVSKIDFNQYIMSLETPYSVDVDGLPYNASNGVLNPYYTNEDYVRLNFLLEL